MRYGNAIGASLIAIIWIVLTARYFSWDQLAISNAISAANLHLALSLFPSSLIAGALWTQLLHSRRGALLPLAAVICLLWNLAEQILLVRVVL